MYKKIAGIICIMALIAPISSIAEEQAEGENLVIQEDFNDEFLSDRWEIMNPDEEGMLVEDGYLQIITNAAKGTFLNPINFVLLKQELKGEYEITLKMKFTATGRAGSWTNNQSAGLVLYQDKENGIILTASTTHMGYFYRFLKIKKNAFMPGFGPKMGGHVKERDVTLRIQRIKRKFIASFLNDKGKWQTIGEYTVLRPKYTKVGIYASRAGGALEDLEKFDSFTFKQLK